MIQLKNLQRSYKTPAGQFFVLRRVNLDIREGEFITVMGPSGAGKSSLLNVLALLDGSWDGEYWVKEPSRPQNETQRARRARQAQHRNGLPELSSARRSHRAREHRPPAFLQG